jgi:hypothetical protein
MGSVIEECLRHFPVVVLTGARQTGKTTLVQRVASAPGRRFLTLDDLRVLEQAQHEPDLLVREAERLTLDEVQRVPDILRAVKRAVDVRRTPGRFLLTGSANLLLMKQVSESLAGRAIYLRLGPMCLAERGGAGGPGGFDELVQATGAEDALRRLEGRSCPLTWTEEALSGGYPAVLAIAPEQRARWFEGYVTTYLERDLQQLAEIAALTDFRRLIGLAAERVGGLLNRADLARDAALTRPTAHRYLNLLDVSFQVRLLPAYATSRGTRLVKSPRLYWTDTGLALHLAGFHDAAELLANPRRGRFLENLVLTEIDVWRETRSPRPEVYYWRTASGVEVDFIIEHGRRLLPMEVKSSTRLRHDDLAGLQRFLAEYAKAPWGCVLYNGPDLYCPAPNIVAVPLHHLLGPPQQA